jgi:hypothetical protein
MFLRRTPDRYPTLGRGASIRSSWSHLDTVEAEVMHRFAQDE